MQEQCGGISPSVLNERLAELREAGIVESTPGSGYGLTREGTALLRALKPVEAWAKIGRVARQHGAAAILHARADSGPIGSSTTRG